MPFGPKTALLFGGFGMGGTPIFFWFFLLQNSQYMLQKSSANLADAIAHTVEGLGYEFVELERLPRGLMRVTIDTDKDGGISTDDCELVSDQLTAMFTVEGIDFARLEVASPGLDRALKRVKDWKRFTQVPVHVELFEPLHAEGFPEAGRRKLDGRIVAVEGPAGAEQVRFSYEELQIDRTPTAAARRLQQLRKKGLKPETAAPIEVVFALADVDRAHLIPQLDFKGRKQQ